MTILCCGDSNTFGYDPRSFLGDRYDSADRWCDLLAAQTGHEVINAGINGQEVPRDAYSFRQTPVDILLIMLGTNDLLRGASAAETAARMDTFLQKDPAGHSAAHEARCLGSHGQACGGIRSSGRRVPDSF